MGVAITSIFENLTTGGLELNIYVIDSNIGEQNKIKLKELEERYNFTITYLYLEKEKLPSFYISYHITEESYYRIFIANLLPNINRVIYLDCDLIVKGDIRELFFTDIGNNIVGAVEECDYFEQKNYFNAGVLLLNLKQWRKENITNKSIEVINEKKEDLKYHDQDVLNIVLKNKVEFLDLKWNLTTLNYFKYHKEVNGPGIFHFTSAYKPWNNFYPYKTPFKREYFKYLALTLWKDYKIPNKIELKKVLYFYLKKILFLFLPNTIIKIIKK